MLFNTFPFAVFFIIVYSLYLVFPHKWQNRLLLVSSYIFYGAWDWRFLFLIFISTALDFVCGLKIHGSAVRSRKKLFLILSVFGNLSILAVFKYFNFFASSLQALLSAWGLSVQPQYLQVVLPVGISFYTFQTMSYAIDIYRGQLRPTKRFFDFALFVAFFPQLVAGPIERARHLLPQVLSPRKMTLDQFYEGCYLIFWGLFLKMFVADNLAKLVDPVFAGEKMAGGMDVLLAVYAFAFQIYCDFAGYSDIARGLGKVMGFDIMVNFNLPYFAANPRDFWRRWHVSLSSWLKDYLYIPLGGNKGGGVRAAKNLMITMLLGGLWHGASWTFVAWGAYHGLLLVGHRCCKDFLPGSIFLSGAAISKLWHGIKVAGFFHLVCFGWIIFRSSSLEQSCGLLRSIVTDFRPADAEQFLADARIFLFFAAPLAALQAMQYAKNDQLILLKSSVVFRAVMYFILFYLLLIYGVTGGKEFIYFQF
ncbi:MAG: MBOAT family O-acyltransferase [Candidatus Omnitrophota bacterium]|nr:MBOAT family O-acyltransferase [Candidatus Omnitrophota bacterium]